MAEYRSYRVSSFLIVHQIGPISLDRRNRRFIIEHIRVAWESCLELWPQHSWLRRSAYIVASMAGAISAVLLLGIWVPNAWNWALDGIGGGIVLFCKIALGLVLAWISGYWAASHPPVRSMAFAAARETVFGRRQTQEGHRRSATDRALEGAAGEYVAWVVLLAIVGGLIGALVGAVLGYAVTYLLALLASIGAAIGAVLVAIVIGIAAGGALVIIVWSGAFVHALFKLRRTQSSRA